MVCFGEVVETTSPQTMLYLLTVACIVILSYGGSILIMIILFIGHLF